MPGTEIIKGLIFDLDGVIVDTAKYHFKAWQRLAHSLGGELTKEQNEHLKGVSRMESLDQILKWNRIQLTEDQKQQLAAKKNSWYQELIQDLSPSEALEGAIPFLDDVLNKGYKIALGSASKNAPAILKGLQITSKFDAIIDGNKTTKSKPDPQVFLMGAEAMGLQAEEVIVFEDALKGIEAAQIGGFHTVGVGDSKQLESADCVIPSLGDQSIDVVINCLKKLKKNS